jgi:hypothetical protein
MLLGVPAELASGAAPDGDFDPAGWSLDAPAVPAPPRGWADAAGLVVAAPAAGIVTTLVADGRLWNASTPMRPATVAVITIGARLTAPGLRCRSSAVRPFQASETERLCVDLLGVRPELLRGVGDLGGEPAGPANVHVTVCDIGHERPKRPGVEPDLVP